MIYHNTPVAPTRPPSTQFLLDPRADLSRPVVALITATNNPRAVMRETATTLFGQSLQNFVWVIVDDHTDEPSARDLLVELARDPRVVVVRNPGAAGLAAARNVGLEHVFAHYDPPPKYLVSLDDDDLFEFTALEKTCWMLESNPDFDIGGFRYIKWGASNETVTTGLHSGQRNWRLGNFVPNAAVYTSRALEMSGCRYNEVEFHDGGEDWDFWMCLADAGLWGGTILEPLYWCVFSPSLGTRTRASGELTLPDPPPLALSPSRAGTASTTPSSAPSGGATRSSTALSSSRRTSSASTRPSTRRSRSRSPSTASSSRPLCGSRRSSTRSRTPTSRSCSSCRGCTWAAPTSVRLSPRRPRSSSRALEPLRPS